LYKNEWFWTAIAIVIFFALNIYFCKSTMHSSHPDLVLHRRSAHRLRRPGSRYGIYELGMNMAVQNYHALSGGEHVVIVGLFYRHSFPSSAQVNGFAANKSMQEMTAQRTMTFEL